MVVSSTEAGPAVVAAGGIPPLTQLLASPEPFVQSAAAGALRNLALPHERKNAIVAAGAVPALLRLLSSCRTLAAEQVRLEATTVLHNLTAGGCRAETLQAFITAGAIPALVELVRNAVSNLSVREAAASALNNLAASGNEGVAAITAAGGSAVLQAALEGEASTDALKAAAYSALSWLHEPLQASR